MQTPMNVPMNAVDRRVPLAPSSHDGHDTLPTGTRLHEFEVLSVLGVGGFGIVYLAMDHSLQRQVAIKEYMPTALAVRADGEIVSLRSASHAETFEMGLQSFINEARLLAQFDHPSLVKVYRHWEGHGTAYMAMQYYPGSTLKDARRAMARAPDEAWLRSVIEPLLGALEVLHAADVFHRDIAPDNILLLPDHRPVLLDFGAARRVIGDRTQTLTAILKPNYAPVEQYPDTGMRQGPWTDLYALAAVARFMITGQSPPPATARVVDDEMRPLATPCATRTAGVSASFLSAIDWALAVRPQDRPHSVQVFRDALNGDFMPPRSSMWTGFDAEVDATTPRAHEFDRNETPARRAESPPRAVRGARWRSRAVALAAMFALGVLVLGIWAQKPRAIHAAGVPTARSAPSGTPAIRSAKPAAPAQPIAAVAEQPAEPPQAFPDHPTGARTALGSPLQACAERGATAMPACVSRECRRPYFREHPQCLKVRETLARQQEQKAH
jgi:serine/threonine protein kinase